MPAWLRRLRARLRYRHFDGDLRAELEVHRAQMQADLEAAGVAPGEAARRAARDFGNATLAREQSRRVWIAPSVESLVQDIRYGTRVLRRNPAFALNAIVVLALGIGANIALFSVVHGLTTPNWHVGHPEELFSMKETLLSGQVVGGLQQPVFTFFRTEGEPLATFTQHGVWDRARVAMGDRAERMNVEIVDSHFFDVVQVATVLGRPFRPEDDDVTNPELSIVISDDMWSKWFDRSRDVLGATVRVNERFYRVIGVAAKGFRGVSDPGFPVACWVTRAQFDARLGTSPIGRLKAGVSFETFQALVNTRAPALREKLWSGFPVEIRHRYPNWLHTATFPVFRLNDARIPWDPDVQVVPRTILVALTAVVVLVLAIAITNIAGLLMARGVTRTGEVAVRRALGASRLRLVRQLLTETVLLSCSGGAVGVGLAVLSIETFRRYVPPAYAPDVVLDLSVLFFALVLALGTGILVGLTPALQAMRVDVIQALGVGVVGARRTAGRLSRWIVAPQVALSLVLLLVAAVHVRALATVELRDLGYRIDNTLVFNVGRWEPTAPRPETKQERDQQVLAEAEKVRRFNRSVLARMGDVHPTPPHALTTGLPLYDVFQQSTVVDRDDHLAGLGAHGLATRVAVSDGYFSVMGMRLLKGRTFDDRDILWGTRTAVISEHLARTLWPTGDPIGRSIGVLPGMGDGTIEWLSVVGIVNEVDPVLGAKGDQPRVYVSLTQEWRGYAYNLIVQGQPDDAALIRDVRNAVAGADPFAEVTNVQTMNQLVGELLYPRRTAAGILTAAGLIGLALACIGLYGLVRYAAAQRLPELGLRAALGATPRALIATLVRDGARVSAIGITAGAVLGTIAVRVTSNSFPGLPSVDVVSLVVVPLLLAFVTLMACFLPARRAARVDPARVLRGE